MEIKQKLDMLEKIYLVREEELEQENKIDKNELKEKLNKVTIEEIENKIKKITEKNADLKETKEIVKGLELLIENYEMQIDYYKEKNYKIGFKDAINLYTQCLKEK